MAQDKRYKLYAYVCGRDCVRINQHEGVMTYHQVFTERPEDCRYAVVEAGPRKFLVWDMYDVWGTWRSDFRAPPPIRTCTTADSAVVATALLYGEEP